MNSNALAEDLASSMISFSCAFRKQNLIRQVPEGLVHNTPARSDRDHGILPPLRVGTVTFPPALRQFFILIAIYGRQEIITTAFTETGLLTSPSLAATASAGWWTSALSWDKTTGGIQKSVLRLASPVTEIRSLDTGSAPDSIVIFIQ